METPFPTFPKALDIIEFILRPSKADGYFRLIERVMTALFGTEEKIEAKRKKLIGRKDREAVLAGWKYQAEAVFERCATLTLVVAVMEWLIRLLDLAARDRAPQFPDIPAESMDDILKVIFSDEFPAPSLPKMSRNADRKRRPKDDNVYEILKRLVKGSGIKDEQAKRDFLLLWRLRNAFVHGAGEMDNVREGGKDLKAMLKTRKESPKIYIGTEHPMFGKIVIERGALDKPVERVCGLLRKLCEIHIPETDFAETLPR